MNFISNSGAWASLYHGTSTNLRTKTGTAFAKWVYSSGTETDSYGDVIEGDVYVIFEVDGVTYRKDGWIDSYGSVDMDGGIRPATKMTKVVEYWQ